MKNLLLLIVPLAVASAGCTATSLERNTVNQIQTAADYRYQATLHALAMVAADPGTLPSFSLLSNGVTSVSDTGVANSVTTWTGSPVRFAFEALAFTGSHSPQIQWTVDPVADDTQLEAMRCACRWVLEGPQSLDEDCLHILDDPEADLTPGPHFGVAERLVRLPEHWLGVGRACDVPRGACYQDHCGNKYVWVTPDGTEGLANFTLVLQDIATLNVAPSDNSLPANRTPPVLATLWVVQNAVSPTPAVAHIFITKNPATGRLVYRNESDNTPHPKVVVVVGQYVKWHNNTKQALTIKSPTFDTVDLKPNGPDANSKLILFDQAMYAKALGLPNDYVPIAFSSNNPLGDENAQLRLTNDPARSFYSPTLVFRVDRVVKPQCRHEIEQRIAARVQDQPSLTGPMKPVDISWHDWMEMTTPYQGQRTSAKPGAATATPTTQPPRLLAPNDTNARPFYRTQPKDVPGAG
jgi:hypothetical protein